MGLGLGLGTKAQKGGQGSQRSEVQEIRVGWQEERQEKGNSQQRLCLETRHGEAAFLDSSELWTQIRLPDLKQGRLGIPRARGDNGRPFGRPSTTQGIVVRTTRVPGGKVGRS